MATTSDLDRVTMIVLRYMRGPVFVLIFVYAVGVLGMALVPGSLVDGERQYMSLFHAFYFFTYSATTTGFGEIPIAFSDEQRLWAVFCLFLGVIAWLYAIGSVISLIQNPHFVSAVSAHRLARLVRKIPDPFYLVCGFGDTGSLLARGLSDHYMRAVILDVDAERIKALGLRDYNIRMPGLCADATVPKHLINAGVQQPNCKAVLVLTGDEDINLKISVMTRYLNPRVSILCRSSSPRHQEHLEDLGAVTVIDPFKILAYLIRLAITRPHLHNLNSWLVQAQGIELGQPLQMPKGRWILCGYGRFGRSLNQQFRSNGIETSIIDSQVRQDFADSQVLMSDADYHALYESGVETAVGIVAGTNLDASNLGILMSARRLNSDLFTLVRQNHHVNQPVFDAARVSFIVQASLTTARRILKQLKSPLIQSLVDHLSRRNPLETHLLIERLQRIVGDESPHLWQVELNHAAARILWERLNVEESVSLDALIRNPDDLRTSLRCTPLAILRDGKTTMLPAASEMVRRNDIILFCGTELSKRILEANLNNWYTLEYLLTGVDPPRGFFFAWLAARHSAMP